MKDKIKNYTKDSESELLGRELLNELLSNNPIPDDQRLSNLGLFIDSKNLAKLILSLGAIEKV